MFSTKLARAKGMTELAPVLLSETLNYLLEKQHRDRRAHTHCYVLAAFSTVFLGKVPKRNKNVTKVSRKDCET